MSDRTPDIGWYTFIHDFADGGIDTVADEIAGSGAGHANLALVYHAARDLLPRNPRRAMRFMEGGAHYFTPDHSLYPAEMQPVVDSETLRNDHAPAIRDALVERGLDVNAWAVFLHNDRGAQAEPTAVQRNVFGDPMRTDLCPTNPLTRRFALALATDLARLHPSAVMAESLHFHGLMHGYHHERYLFELGPLAELALSLCFCEHCMSTARQAGIDVDAVGLWGRAVVGSAFAGRPTRVDGELTFDSVRDLAGGHLGPFLSSRCRTVESLTADVRDLLDRHGVRLIVLDPSGAVKGWSDRRPEGAPVHETGWRFGIRAGVLSSLADAVEVLGYTQDAGRLAMDLDGYRSAVGPTGRLRVSVRPALPDTLSAQHLAEKLEIAAARGVTAVDFYHYGLLPDAAASMVRETMRGFGRVGVLP